MKVIEEVVAGTETPVTARMNPVRHSQRNTGARAVGQDVIEMAESQTSKQQSGPSASTGSTKSEFPCPDCGEMVREGLVRCWNCGGFLRPELEERFQKIQSRPQQIIYSPATQEETGADLDAMLASPAQESSGSSDDEDSGFQLTGLGTVRHPQESLDDSETDDDESSPSEETDELEPAEDAAASEDGEGEVPPSAAAGGDALMQLAAQEEMERLKRKVESGTAVEGVRIIRDGFLIDAPKGCRIQIRDEHTGEMRRLTFPASSRVRISLLDKLKAIQKAQAEKEARAAAGPQHLSAGVYKRWMSDCHLHTLNPEKLKLKADSMTNEFVPVEVGFAPDNMLVASLPAAKKGGLFAKGGESADDARNKLLQHFRAGNSIADAPAGETKTYTADQVAEIRVVQPAASLSESLFAGIPVFGTGRIAVHLPLTEPGEQPRFLSFTLTRFREFVDIIGSLYSLAEFGRNIGIPLVDAFTEHNCHLSGAVVRALEHLPFYEADPEIEIVLAGWLCSSCGAVLSEEVRDAEKLGGKGGKSIAKAKCPNCEQKLGHNPLHTLPSTPQPDSESEESAEDQSTATSEEAAAADE